MKIIIMKYKYRRIYYIIILYRYGYCVYIIPYPGTRLYPVYPGTGTVYTGTRNTPGT